MKNLFSISLLFLFIGNAFGQGLGYKTTTGHIVVSCEYDSLPVLSESHQFKMFLDPVTEEFEGELDIISLSCGIDSLDDAIKNAFNGKLHFKGTLANEDFSHLYAYEKATFNVPVEVTLNGITHERQFQIEIYNYNGSSTYSFMMNGFIELDLKDWGITNTHFKKSFKAQFTQLILRNN